MSNKKVLRLADLHKKLGMTSVLSTARENLPEKSNAKQRPAAGGLISILPAPADTSDKPAALPLLAPREEGQTTAQQPVEDATTKKRHVTVDVSSLPESKYWDELRANPHIEVKEVREADYTNSHWEEEYSRHIDLERLKSQQTSKLVVTEKRRKTNHIMALAEEAIMQGDANPEQLQQKSKRETGAKYGW